MRTNNMKNYPDKLYYFTKEGREEYVPKREVDAELIRLRAKIETLEKQLVSVEVELYRQHYGSF